MKNSIKNRALEGTRSGDVVGGSYCGPGKAFGRFFVKGGINGSTSQTES